MAASGGLGRNLRTFASRSAFCVPAGIVLLLVLAYPVARTTLLSVFRLKLANGFQEEFSGLENFFRLAYDSRFHDSLIVTANFTVASVALEFGIGLFLALSVDRVIRGRGIVRSILLAPWTLPTAVIAVLWAWIFNDQYGVLNVMLQRAHVVKSAIPWLASPETAMIAIVIADVWKTTAFVFLVLLAGLQSVPDELYEAMAIDGGGWWARFRYVTWPFLLPFVFLSMVFRIIQAFAIFDLVYVMTGGGPGGATETVSVYTYQTYMRYLDIGYGSAQVVATVVILAMTAFVLHCILLRGHESSL
jgi:multiple sugar transport system permease protein